MIYQILSIRFIIHYGLHFIFPALIAYLYNSKEWKKNWLILLATMVIDVDHLMASPIFDANRCSIGFHPLHTEQAFVIYLFFGIFSKFRLFSIGLILHLFTDFVDCL